MAHPLDGMLVKLARADEHLDTIQKDIQRLIHTNVDLIPSEFDPNTGQYVFRAQRDNLSADWLSPVVGDFVHNAKAALDYLVWELTGAAGTTRTEFPIFTDPDRYRTDAPRKIKGIPPEAVTVIKKLQPFYGPNSQPGHPEWNDPELEPLALLYALNTHDKHRALNLTEHVLSVRIVGLEGLHIVTPPVAATLVGNFKAGAVIARMTNFSIPANVNVYLRATSDIAFDRDGPAAGEPVIEVLQNVRQAVRGRVVPALRRFFPP
jgi:hypothetical protein